MNKQERNKSGVTTTGDVSDFLRKTGFILEMEVAEILKNNCYKVTVNSFFYDYDKNVKREIDIVAVKEVNDIKLRLVIECKQSSAVDWVFVCTDNKPERFYNYVKHLPKPNTDISKTKMFDHLHTLDFNIPLAQNFITRHKKGKQDSPEPINTCIKKLPKAVVDIAHGKKFHKQDREIILPLAVFSGQFFKADYDGELKVSEVPEVQFAMKLDSESYVYHYSDFTLSANLFRQDDIPEEVKNSPVADTARELGSDYLIDFVTKDYLNGYLERIETDAEKINLNLWELEPYKGSSEAEP